MIPEDEGENGAGKKNENNDSEKSKINHIHQLRDPWSSENTKKEYEWLQEDKKWTEKLMHIKGNY